jgi:TolB-like protein
MKKDLFVFVFLQIMTIGTLYAQNALSLDETIRESVNKLEEQLPPGTKVAVLNFISSSNRLSGYIIDEVIDILTNNKKIGVVERSRLETIREERGYQLSGEVADNEIKSIGNQSGAEYIISGSMNFSGTAYRYRLYAINIEDGVREAMSSLQISATDRQIAYFLSGTSESAAAGNEAAKEAWKNKWFYLAPLAGGGLYNYSSEKGEKRKLDVFAVGLQGQLQLHKYFALETDIAIGIGEILVPLIPLLAEFTITLNSIELNAGIGYTIMAGFTVEGSIGVNIGNGILFGEVVYVDIGDLNKNNQDSNAFVFVAGYKFGLGSKK